MPIRIFGEEKIKLKQTQEEVVEEIRKEIYRYFDNANKSSEIGYIFLKSVIYVEEIIKNINKDLHGASKYTGLEKHLEQIDLIEDERVKKSSKLLKQVKDFRDKMAHNLDYHIEEDEKFFKLLGLKIDSSTEEKKRKIFEYFKDVAEGFIFLKILIDLSDKPVFYFSKS